MNLLQGTNSYLRRTLLAGLAGTLLAAGCSRPAVPPEPPPPLGISDLDEQGWQNVRARYRGRVLLVNFWATWCDPCREEFPGIVRLYQDYRAQGLSVVAISMDEPESVPAIEKFLKAQGAQFGSYRHHFRDFSALVDSINKQWGGGIPATFLYDPQGRLVQSWEGATPYGEFERAVRPLLPREQRWYWPARFQ
jgi:thiol-disulfide isomerase/thioredoxin